MVVPPAREAVANAQGKYSLGGLKSMTVDQPMQRTSASSRLGNYLAPLFIMATDYIALVMALMVAWYLRADFLPLLFTGLNPFNISGVHIFCVIPLCYISFLAYEGMYVKRLPFWQGAEHLFKISTYAAGLVVIITYFTGDAARISRVFTFAMWGISFLFLTLSRYCTKNVLAKCGVWEKPVVIIGIGKTTKILSKVFENDPYIGYKIIGSIADKYDGRQLTNNYPYIGTFNHAEKAILNSGVEDVIIAAHGLRDDQLMDIVYRVQPCVKNLIVVPNLLGFPLSNLRAQTLFDEKIMLLSVRNNMMVSYNRLLKRGFDFVCGIAGTVMIAPLLVAIAIAIYIDSPGAVIFAHKRIGANGKLFPCYKFRSMIPDAQKVLDEYLKNNPSAREEWERDFKLKDDPRITTVGKFLRKTSLDEFPQLMNVIKGEMSLVGPRPIIDEEVPKYGEYINDYFMVRPGMTGFWQVSGRNDVDYGSRVQMDSWYVRNWSVWLDMVLLCKTVKVVLVGKGAY